MNANHGGPAPARRTQDDPFWVRLVLILAAVGILFLLIILPVIHVFYEAFANGAAAYFHSLWDDADTRHAIGLTMTVAPIAVAMNLAFGLAAAWAIARFRFPGRTLLVTLIDLPFAISPVVVGLIFMLLVGRYGYFGDWLFAHGIKIAYALPGIIIVTAFVTVPFVARELIPVMEVIGPEEELAAVSLGANAWQMFWRITLPNIKWGLLYGLILCFARAIGEFGAVNVIAARVGGDSQTVPIRIEQLNQDYRGAESFALASVLTLLALGTLILKVWLERRVRAAGGPDNPVLAAGEPV